MSGSKLVLAALAVAACVACSAKKSAARAAYPSNQATAGSAITATPAATPTLPEQLVVEAWITLEVDEVGATAAALRGEVERAGGRVVTEQLGGAATAWSGEMSMRLPPAAVDAFLGFLASQGTVASRRIQATDVSKQLFDMDLALANLQQTMTRLQQLLDAGKLDMKDVLAIESEMTRVHGEIERIKGEQRWLADRVAFATVQVTLQRKAGAVFGPRAKLFPGGRFAVLTLLAPDGRTRTRTGGGVTILFPRDPSSSLRAGFQIDAFEGPGTEDPGIWVSLGVGTYSDFLGRGRRRFLNPYLGLRIGYARVDGDAFAISGTAGVELFKHEYVLIDASVDLLGLVRRDFDAALIGGVGAVFAF